MADPAAAAIEVTFKLIVEGIFAQIKRQCNYLCCLKSNVRTLAAEAERLNAEQTDLKKKVDVATRDGPEIKAKVKNWLEETTKILAEKVDIEKDISHVQSCSNITLRYSLSRRAKKAAEAMEQLRNCNDFGDDIALPPPAPAAMVQFSLESSTLQCRKEMEATIVAALNCPDVNIVGIWGIGGTGKTFTAKNVVKIMKTGQLVDETVEVVVSQEWNVLRIQQDIAEHVGLDLKDMTAPKARAIKLQTRLRSKEKKIIVLDDIWELLHFDDIGIPCGSDSSDCKILLTSRDKKVLHLMGVRNQNCFPMELLAKEDAWSLLRDKAGTCVDDTNLKPTAEQVLDECKGLPLAIVTVGGALKDQQEIGIWEDALHQLKIAAPTNITGVLKHVYNPLRLSYDYLDSKDAKSLFLLCCIFPEDFEISLEDLALYGMGLNMFDEVDNLSRARNRVFTVVEKLKSCALLLDGKNEKHVKMHDVVRDVARFIARKEEKFIDEQLGLKWAFIRESAEDSNYKIGSNFQCLRLLIIRYDGWESIDGFPSVGAMQELEVLSLQQSSLELTDCCSKNLKTLKLKYCRHLTNLSFVGNLRGLEILKCKSYKKIEELPIEIGNLERLKLLDLSHCQNLKRIRPGVISRLIELEELKMSGSFKEWESTKIMNEEEGERNASLKELESLKKLTWLEIEIANIELVKEDVSLPETIVKYDIRIGGYRFIHKDKVVSSYPCLLTKHNHCFQSWIHKFVSAGEELYLNGDLSSKFIASDCFGSMVKTLEIENEKELASLVNTSRIFTDLREGSVFPVLECLNLNNLPNLVHIYDGPIQNGSISFRDLRKLELENLPSLTKVLQGPNQNVTFNQLSDVCIGKCNDLCNLFGLEKTKDVTSKLVKLVIFECEKMEEVFLIEKNEQVGKENNLTFSNLVEMEIKEMASLTTFGKGIESIEFPSLTKLYLSGCPKFKWIDSQDGCSHDEYFHYFCNKKVTFGMLKELTIKKYDIARSLWCRQITPKFFRTLERLSISKCHNIRIFCSLLIAKNLIHLKNLSISNCDHMESMIGVEKQTHHSSTRSSEILEGFSINEENEDGGTIRPFPKLEILEFCSLKNFKTLREGTETFELHMLSSLIIQDCPHIDGCNNDNDRLHLFCGEQLPPYSSSSLTRLDIRDYNTVSNLWCQQIPPCFFQSLETLKIWNCNKLKSAFPYSVAKHLLNLQNLYIFNCKQMELVVSGLESETHEQNSILFPRLAYVILVGLPSLEMFYKRGCSLTLPLLESMEVDWQTVYGKSTNEGVEDWNNILCQHIIMSKRKEEEERRRKKKEEEEEEEEEEASNHSSTPTLDPEEEERRREKIEEEERRKKKEEDEAETTPILDAPTNEELHKDELHVDEVPSLSRQEFGLLTPFEVQPMPVLEQAESSTAAATMDKMTAEITCPNQLIEQQTAQHHA